MSLFNHATVTCPRCGTEFGADVVASVNADRRPDLRQEIIDGVFQAQTCAKCGARFRLPPNFSYVDVARAQWIMAYPADEVLNWAELEAQAKQIFDISYGVDAPEVAQDLGTSFATRIVFGWPALREKLLCTEFGLDDVTLELLKAAVMRSVQKPPFANSTELRLVGTEHGALLLAWLSSDTEATLASLEVPRDIYADIEGDGAAWSVMHNALTGHSFADLNRLLVIPAAAA